jgi:heat shock protein HtpX
MAERTSVSPRRPGLIAAVFVGITAIAGLFLGAIFGFALVGLLLGVALALVGIVWAYASGIAVLMRVLRAEQVSEREQPRLHNLVEGLCMTAGVVTPPVLHVIDDAAPNAVVVAVSPNKSAIAITTGMLMACDRVELEAVVAHLVARLRSGYAIAGSLTTLLIGAPLLLGQLGVRKKWWDGGRRSSQGEQSHVQERYQVAQRSSMATLASGGGALMLSVLTPLLTPPIRVFVPRDLVRQADLAACQITRYPPALISVLARSADESGQTALPVSHAALGVTNHLWFLGAISGLDGQGPLTRFHRSLLAHPPTEGRIAFLKEL